MTSPLQVLFFFAITLAPPGTHHVTISGGSEVYSWDKGDSNDDAATWVYDGALDPRQVLANNAIVPDHFSNAERETVDAVHRRDATTGTLYFDSGHALEQTSQGYVYVVRPGSTNEKFYSFKFY